jgi:hypothetical protein
MLAVLPRPVFLLLWMSPTNPSHSKWAYARCLLQQASMLGLLILINLLSLNLQ